MGVDIDTYRGRIGTFKHSCGQDVVTIVCVINFSRGLKYVGAVLFIGILLLIAGIEANPGPGRLLSYFFVAIVVVVLGLLLQGAESEEHRFFAVCILVATLLLCYASENASRSHKTKAEENREGDETPKQTSRATNSILQRDAVIPLRVGSQEPDVTVQLHEDHGPEILQQTVSSLNVQESDTTVPQASSMLKKAEENREDKCIDDSLQLPTLDSDKSSRALPRSRRLGEPSAEQSEDEYTAQQVSLDDTADYQNKQVAVLSPESSTIQENENREDQSKEDNGIQMSTFFPDQSTGAIPKSRTPGDIAENRKHQNKDDGIQQPTLGADPSSGAIPKSRPRREEAGDSIGIEHDHGNLIKLTVQSVSVDTSGSISKEEEYFVSQVLTFKACRDVFRELFIHMATKDGASINKTVELLQNNETLIKALNAKQRGLWSIDDWDLNHFATVLKNGFKSELKNNESKAIECIRTIRNNVIHSPNSSLTFEKYDDNRKALENATTTLCSRLNSSAKARFTTIIKKYEPERLNMDTIPQDFKDFRGEGYALLLKMLEVPRIYNAFKEALGKNITNPDTGRFVLKQIKEVKVCITFEGHTEDKTKIENGQSQILKIFESEAEQNNVSVILSIVVSRIKEDLNSMQDVEFRGTESGSIILNIHVFSITALLEVLQYIESQPLQSKLDVIADELSKKYDFQNPLRLSAALSTQTLLCLYKDFVLDESDEGNTPFSSADTPKETIYRRTGTTASEIGLTSDDLKEDTLDKDRERENYFKDLTARLNLENRREKKISIKDVISINSFENEHKETELSEGDLPWTLLKQLITAKYNARDRTVTLVKSTEDTDSKLASWQAQLSKMKQKTSKCVSQLSALDVFIVIFQCCDPMMKRLLVQKMYLSKLAIPFMYYDFTQSNRILSLWPLRSLTVENYRSNNSFDTIDVLDLPSKVFAFARFDRPAFSKSKLLNSLLSNETCNTFFNTESLSGTSPRHLNSEFIEMFWMPKVCTEKDRFKDPVVLLNLRGDIRQYTSDTCHFISNISDLFVIVINIKDLKTNRSAIETAIKHFQRIIFVITHSEHEVDEIEGVLEMFLPPLEKEKQIVDVDFTYDKNMFEIASTVTAIINKHSSSEYNTLEKRLIDVNMVSIVSDEESELSTRGKAIAGSIFQKIELAGNSPETWKSTVTPVHYEYSPKLGSLMKAMHRDKDGDETGTLTEEIEGIRRKQLENITDTVRCFLRNIIEYREQKPLLDFILSWLTVFIDRKKRTIIPTLTKQNASAWEQRKEIVSRDSKATDQINENEKLIVKTENAIRAASFGIENLFREIGHIYDAFMMLSISPDSKQLPSVEEVAGVYADLFSDGHTLEIIDGESFYMPYEWIKCVMEIATKKIESKKVFAISALGLQSSGKSTLLNTMFGLQFETSSGRCTRGINIHLVHINQSDKMQVPFDYVLVIDTEGLRAPELMCDKHEHDNELATVITGLGDITIINIMGENLSEMNEVLQVVVTAFLRLKLVNRSLDVRKSCVLVQQNVTELSAHDKLKPALRKTKEELDRKTKESAEMHDIQDIETFDQLIEFDITKQVCYLPNMWQGNPPLAVVNLEYTKRVSSIKYQLIEIASLMKSKSYKTLNDLTSHANDLWRGVLSDDFVFSFRNSLEIKAFVLLEQKMQAHLSEFDSNVYEKFLEVSREKFCQCEDENDLTNAKQRILNDIEEIWSEQYSSLEKEMSNYFDKHDNKDIIKQWDEYSKRRIEASCVDLLNQIKVDVDKFKEKRNIDIYTNERERAHEDKIYDESLQLAKELKGKNLEKEKLDKEFNTIWDKLISGAQLYPRRQPRYNESMRKAFINGLYKIFHRFAPLVKQQLTETDMLSMPEPSPFGSFDNIGITSEDIKLSRSFHDRSQKKKESKDMALVKDDVEKMLKDIDKMLENILSENEGEINSHQVKSFIKQADAVFQKMQKEKEYSLEITFQIKFLVYISWFGHNRFESHNADRRENRSTEVRLERYKGHMREMFYARLQDRKAEETAALSLSQTIENVLRNAVSEMLPSKILTTLSNSFPKVKGQLIIDILADLVRKNNFYLFARFNHTPKAYAEDWINAEAERIMFHNDPSKYSTTASAVIAELFTDIRNGIKSNVKNTSDKTTIYSFEDWIRGFLANLKRCQIPESECLRAKRGLTDKRLDLKNFEEILLNRLSSLETDLKSEYNSQRHDTAEWCDKLLKKIWGCDAQCPFCLEPCAKTANHEGQSLHKCIQHRLRCCTGVKKVGSQAARLSSCNYDVQSKSTYRCDYLNYICNPEKQEPCKDKNHRYRDYKKFFANWHIEPTASIEDRSKFWMWFMDRFRKQISDYYKMDTSKIPPSWGNISEQTALKSLRMSYTGK